jgi:photosystem II stability/assembly factor-like uncharacterized protein
MLRLPLVFLVLLSFLSSAAHALQFSPAGPIGQPAHPPVTAVAVSPSAPHVVYAAAAAKLYRSSDGGETWLAFAPPPNAIQHIAVDPIDNAIVYVIGQNKLYRSDDSGATWKSVSAGLSSSLASWTLRIDPQDPSMIYIGGRCTRYTQPLDGGVFKSANRGETWVRLNPAVNCVDALSLDPAAPQRLFAATGLGEQFRTDDAGWRWQQSRGLPAFDVVADPLDPSRHYGLGPSGSGGLNFLVSTNAGATWAQVPAEGLPPGGQQLALDPATRRLFLLGQSFGLFVSDDLGLHWRRIAAVPTVTATNLIMAAASDRIYVATARGLYRLSMSDPDVPTVIHLGEPAPLGLTIQRITVDPNDASTLYASAYEGYGVLNAYRVFRSTDSARTWERITAEDDIAWRNLMAVDAVGDLYAVYQQTVWRFAKTTQTWESWQAPELVWPTTFLANPQRPGWLYAANAGWAGYSTDGGRTWTRIQNVVSGFWSLSIAPTGSDLVGGNNEGVFASSDGGVTWRALWRATQIGGFETKAVAIAPSRSTTIYRLTNTAGAGLMSGLFRSDDGGQTWTALRWPGERDWPLPIAVDPRDDRSIWIGLAHSSDGGVTWTIEPHEPTDMLSVTFNRDGTVLYGVSRDYKVWRATVMRGARRRAVSR